MGKSAALDVGVTVYTYPGGSSRTTFAEPYIKLSGTVGPASLTAGVAYAPKQVALGKWYNTGASASTGTPDNPGAKEDNLYVWTDAAAAIPSLPVTLKGHVAVSKLTLGIAYVDTDISNAEAAYLQPNFSSTKDGKTIAGSKVVVSITAAF